MARLDELDVDDEEVGQQFEELFDAFGEHVDKFADENELPFGIVSLLTMEMSVSARMIDYVTSVEKPSSSGLKLELDRYRREVDDAVRSAKKGADEFLASTKEMVAAARAQEDSDKPE